MDLILLGSLFLVGLVADIAGRFTPLPRVSFLLLSGLLIGPSVLGLISQDTAAQWFPILTNMALSMVGFLIGQGLAPSALREHGKEVVVVSGAEAVGAAIAVGVACVLIGLPLELALVFAGVATATAPAAIFDVVHELQARSPFSKLLLGVVALDDVWGLIVFALLIAFATNGNLEISAISSGLIEIFGSIAVGAALGVPMAYITGRIAFGERAGEPILAESLGFVFIAAGVSAVADLSPILTAIAMGAVVAQLASHHTKPFNAIEGVEWPFMVLFFTMAGASLELEYLTGALGLVLLYLVARAAGTMLGAGASLKLLGHERQTVRWMGPCLLPQAGVALGMALIAAQRFPEHAQMILTVILSSTVILELTTPALTRYALRRFEATS